MASPHHHPIHVDKDHLEKVIAQIEREDREAIANGTDTPSRRMNLAMLGHFHRFFCDEINRGTQRSDIYTAVAVTLVNIVLAVADGGRTESGRAEEKLKIVRDVALILDSVAELSMQALNGDMTNFEALRNIAVNTIKTGTA